MLKKNTALKSKRIQNPLLTEAARTLFANIRFMALDEDIKTLVVTSTLADEGKSTVALNLAMAIASSGKKVLLVDADMRRRNLAQLLEIRPPCGLYAALTDPAKLNAAIVQTSTPKLFFMDCEPDILSPPDILGSRRFSSMLDRLREAFDYIIFDTPPASVFVDAAVLGSMVDGTLFVVREGKTKRELAVKSVQQLRQANANVLGCVMTFVTGGESEQYYRYYTKGSKTPTKTTSGLESASGRQSEFAQKFTWNPTSEDNSQSADSALDASARNRRAHRR
jgi:capsular exopolysaccharide synthesis family protein